MKPLSAAICATFFLAGLVAPAQDFERVQYNHPGLEVDLGVGLWAWPLPMDWDGDGDLDLVVTCPDVPFSGTYFFENPGGDQKKLPTFKPPVRIDKAMRNVQVSYVDGNPRVLTPTTEWRNFPGKGFEDAKLLMRADFKDLGRIRANQWRLADIDSDGDQDLIIGIGAWGDYGWDDAFDKDGNWTRGPLHGYVYLIENTHNDESPKWLRAKRLQAGGKDIDVYGMPSPNLADFDGDGDLDLICGEFLDGFSYFQNTGTAREPAFAAGRRLQHQGKDLAMHVQMITPTAIDWDRDGDTDLIVGDEDGRVALVEHSGKNDATGTPQFLPPVYFQQEAHDLKFGALVTPVSADWDGDGDEDLICGNTSGNIGWFENLDGKNPPKWAAVRLLTAGDQVIHLQAGPNGSIQGPCEAKWGYTTLSVADWDKDGRLDIVANSIWGKVIWFRRSQDGQLETPRPIEVEWPGKAPKPDWNWWDPAGKELVTQWRTTPVVVDWNHDGFPDLVMLDHEGYLALFERDADLKLRPGQRIFRDANGKPLKLSNGTAGKSGRRKLCITDWDKDGDFDILINSTNIDLLENAGDHFAAPKRLGKQKLAGHTTSPTTVDWDKDGTRDLLVGAEDGRLYLKRTPPKPRKPNVLFISIDDLRAELGCYNSDHIISPNIDKLARRGTLFERAYCQQAVCNPSRASLLTGLRPQTLGIWDLPTHFRQRRADIVTLPQHLKQNGYHTEGIGKIFHNWRQDNYRGDAPSWSTPARLHYNSHGNDKAQVEGALPPDLSDIPKCEIRDVPDEAYFDGRVAKLAVEALGRLKQKGDPFFLAVGFWKPHAHFNAPKKYWDLYDRSEIQPAANPLRPADTPEIAFHDGREICRSFKGRAGGIPTPADAIALRHGYYANTSFVDAQLGKVIDALDRLDLAKDTVIVMWSDHGFHLGENGLWAKTSNFELDARVPVIVATPHHPGGQRSQSLVELLDLYPTIAELCGLRLPAHLEGKSLVPLLSDPRTEVKPAAFTWHPRPAYPPDGKDPEAMGYSMRTENFRYTEWRNFTTHELIASELYDHRIDPNESQNTAGNSDNAQLLESLSKQLGPSRLR